MFSVYSNLKQCVENLDEYVSIDSVIALYILEHHVAIPNMSIKELSKNCNTSQASITRFCQRINNSNFKTLKEEIAQYNEYVYREMSNSSDSLKPITREDYFYILRLAIQDTQKLLNDERINQIVQCVHKGKNLYFFGSSFSNNVAKNACEKFNRINKLAFSFSSVKAQLNAINLIEETDVVVFISFSGTNKYIQRLYRLVKKKKCSIIWITSNPQIARKSLSSYREWVLTVSQQSLAGYETALLESTSMNIAIDLLYLQYTNFLRLENFSGIDSPQNNKDRYY